MSNELKVTVTASNFRSLINSTKYIVAKEEYRPILSYIKIDVRDDKLIAYSCDGFRAARVILKLETKTSESFTVFIKPINFSLNVKYVNNVTIGKTNNTAFVEIPTDYGEINYQFKQPSEQSYIDIDNVIDSALESVNRTVNLDSHLLAGMTSIFIHGDIHERGYFKLQTGENPLKPVVLSTQSDDTSMEVTTVLLPVRSL